MDQIADLKAKSAWRKEGKKGGEAPTKSTKVKEVKDADYSVHNVATMIDLTRPAGDSLEGKLSNAILKMISKGSDKLTDLLAFDEKINTVNLAGIKEFDSSNVNEEIQASRGVDLREENGNMIRAGGRYQSKKGTYDMASFMAMRNLGSGDRLCGLSGFGPTSSKKRP